MDKRKKEEIRVAVATSDGIVVNQHFGRTEQFYIVKASQKDYTFQMVEVRKSQPVCHMGEHFNNDMERRVGELSDCDCVLVSKIGSKAEMACQKAQIQVYEIPDYIDSALVKMLKYRIQVSKGQGFHAGMKRHDFEPPKNMRK